MSPEAHDDRESIIGTLAEAKLASVCPNDVPCDREAQAGAARTFSMEWLLDPLPFRDWYPRPVVDDFDYRCIPICKNPNIETCFGAVFQGVMD